MSDVLMGPWVRHVRVEPVFVPHVSVAIAIVLALTGLGVLIYFIHHVAVGIQADAVIAAVARDPDAAIERLFPQRLGAGPVQGARSPVEIPALFEPEAQWVPAPDSGYVRAIDTAGLLALAAAHDLLIRLVHRPGRFVMRDSPVARGWPLTGWAAGIDRLSAMAEPMPATVWIECERRARRCRRSPRETTQWLERVAVVLGREVEGRSAWSASGAPLGEAVTSASSWLA